MEPTQQTPDYIVVSDSYSSTLALRVTALMREGYVPVGGMQVEVRQIDIPPNNMSPRSRRDLEWRTKDVTTFYQALERR